MKPMGSFLRAALVALALLSPHFSMSAQQQLVLPVLHQAHFAGPLQQRKRTFSIEHFNGCPYVLVTQVAGAMDGQVRWRPVARTLEMTIRGKKVSFGWDSSYVHVGDARVRLEGPTVKNDDGFWAPIHFFSSGEFFAAVGSRLEWQDEPV